MFIDRGSELVDDDAATHPGVCGEAQHVAGAVIKPGEDLDFSAVSEPHVREVRLPAFVREVGFEPSIRRLRSLLRGWGDEAGAHQDPMDRRGMQPDVVFVFEMPGDRVTTGIESVAGQLLAHATISETTSGAVARGERFGRFERGSNAASPSAR